MIHRQRGKCGMTLCLTALCSMALLPVVGLAQSAPQVAVIIDDMGDRADLDFRVAELPRDISCAILPHTPHAGRLARQCTDSGKDVLLHLPLQAETFNELLGPGRLELDMDETAFRSTFRTSLASIPGVQGVNNHMGSLLTRHPGAMTWLMQELGREDLFFVDSRTTAHSVAVEMAREQSVPATERDIFLDTEQNAKAINAQLDRAIRIARQTGQVIVIGHPYPETLAVLEQRLPELENREGIRLARVSELIQSGNEGEEDDTDGQARTDSVGERLRGTGSGHPD